MMIRPTFTATPPSLLALSALLGAWAAFSFPYSHVERVLPSAGAASLRAGGDIRPAIYRSSEDSADEQQAWDQLVVTFELVRASQDVLDEAQKLRAIAAALATKSPELGAQASEQDHARHELAEGQLALAEMIIGAAQAHAANTQAAFGVAWQNVQRASQGNGGQDSAAPLHESALQRRHPG